MRQRHELLLTLTMLLFAMTTAAAATAVNVTKILDKIQNHISTLDIVATAKGITTFIKNDLENDADNLVLTVDLTAAKKMPRKDDLKIVVYHANSVAAAVACEGYLVEYIDRGYFKCSLSNNENVRFVNGINNFDLEVYGARTGKRYARQRIPGGIFYLDPSIVVGYSPYGENVISDKNITYALQVLQVSMGTVLFKLGLDQVLDRFIDNSHSQGGKKKRPPRPPPRPKITPRTTTKKHNSQNKPTFGLFGSTTYTNTGVKVVSSHDRWSQTATKASSKHRHSQQQKKSAAAPTASSVRDSKKKRDSSSATNSLTVLSTRVSGALARISARITSLGTVWKQYSISAWVTSLDTVLKQTKQAISVLNNAARLATAETYIYAALVVLLPSLGVATGAIKMKSSTSNGGSESYQRSIQSRKSKPSPGIFDKIKDKTTKKGGVYTNKAVPAPAAPRRRPSVVTSSKQSTSAYAI